MASVDRLARVVYTATGEPVPYDMLVVASGARADPAVPGALTFQGFRGDRAVRGVLTELDKGSVSSVGFAAPPGVSWTLPLYELALLSAHHLTQQGRTGRVVLVVPDAAPLELFGSTASDAVADLLEDAGIELHCGHHAREVVEGSLRLVPEKALAVDRVIALPRLRGPHLAGLPSTEEGFIPTDDHGRVDGTERVYAAGDATAFAVKHGGVSIDQATAVAESVAAQLGVALRPRPFRPVLRGLLLTGAAPRFLWSDLADDGGDASAVTAHPLWWPPGKIAGGRLAKYLQAEGLPVPPPPAGPAMTLADIDPRGERRLRVPVRPRSTVS